jgi:hypothetical protein
MSASDHPSFMAKPTWQRYVVRVLMGTAAYIAVLVPVDYGARHGLLPGKPWLYAVALAPALPMAIVVWIMARYVLEEEDEYQRMLNTRAYVAATGLTLALCTGWGFLQKFAGLSQIPLMHVFTLFCVSQGVTTLWVRLRSLR